MLSERITDNTLVDAPRLHSLITCLESTQLVPGHNAEVGVYKGGTAYLIATYSPLKTLHLFDTFKGMPAVSAIDLHKKGDFSDTSKQQVECLLAAHDNTLIYEGLFPQTAKALYDQKFSFVHVDCDIYTSVKDCIQFFWPRLSKGGIIAFDDYDEPNCPGAKKAVDEWLNSEGNHSFTATHCQSQLVVRKQDNDG